MVALNAMTSAPIYKGLHVGYPGAGKTGCLASVMNTGRFKLRVLDFDGKFDPLRTYIKPEYHANVDIVTLKDMRRLGAKRMETVGRPVAFAKAMDLLNHWKYKNADGTETDLGKPSEWGGDTILLVDSLTNMGQAVMNWTLFCQDRVVKGPRKADWGIAQHSQEAVVQAVMSREAVGCHVVLTAHLKLIGPPGDEEDDEDKGPGGDPTAQEARQKLMKFVGYKLFPSALGRALPPEIAKHCPFVIRHEVKIAAGRVKRVMQTVPNLDFDGVTAPLIGLPDELPIEDGLLRIFTALEKGGTV